MQQVQMEYWELNNEKVNEFNFLNEKVGKFKRNGVKAWLM